MYASASSLGRAYPPDLLRRRRTPWWLNCSPSRPLLYPLQTMSCQSFLGAWTWSSKYSRVMQSRIAECAGSTLQRVVLYAAANA